ncbi:MAG: barstar family protein [Crocinitomicaceae bacterium]|nr:barstar family protein [Crocinitomicaceae bacterium]
MKTFEIDGEKFNTLSAFFNEIGSKLVENNTWGKNWNAFDDILVGGFVLTEYEEPFKLIWINSDISKDKLKDFNDIVKQIQSHAHITL